MNINFSEVFKKLRRERELTQEQAAEVFCVSPQAVSRWENETAIQTALSKLIENKTVIIIAHRMRTVSGADKIVVLSDGTVKESGKPDDLLKQGGIFARMVQAQTEGEKWTIS